MKLKELLKGVEIVQIIGNEQVEITNITQDSRKIIQNTLFFRYGSVIHVLQPAVFKKNL